MTRLGKFLAHRRSDRSVLLEALLWLCWSKLLLLLVPFRWVAPHLGSPQVQSPSRISPEELARAERISWAVQSVARHVPLGLVCLPQAMAAKWMLRRRGLASTLYLGLACPGESKSPAHAWLRAGPKILTGQRESASYVPITTFAEPGLPSGFEDIKR